MFKITQSLNIEITGLFNESCEKDALNEFRDLIEPLLDEIEEKLSDRFTVRLELDEADATDLEQDKADRLEDEIFDAILDD